MMSRHPRLIENLNRLLHIAFVRLCFCASVSRSPFSCSFPGQTSQITRLEPNIVLTLTEARWMDLEGARCDHGGTASSSYAFDHGRGDAHAIPLSATSCSGQPFLVSRADRPRQCPTHPTEYAVHRAESVSDPPAPSSSSWVVQPGSS